MSNTKSVKVVIGVKMPRIYNLKDGTKILVKPEGPSGSSDPELYMKIGGKYPLVNLLTGDLIHWSVANELDYVLPLPGSTIEILIDQERLRIKLRNEYVKVRRVAPVTHL